MKHTLQRVTSYLWRFSALFRASRATPHSLDQMPRLRTRNEVAIDEGFAHSFESAMPPWWLTIHTRPPAEMWIGRPS